MKSIFTAVIEKVNDWYIGYIEELPGANTQGKTVNEVRSNLQEAVKLILESNRELADKELAGREVIKEDIMVEV